MFNVVEKHRANVFQQETFKARCAFNFWTKQPSAETFSGNLETGALDLVIGKLLPDLQYRASGGRMSSGWERNPGLSYAVLVHIDIQTDLVASAAIKCGQWAAFTCFSRILHRMHIYTLNGPESEYKSVFGTCVYTNVHSVYYTRDPQSAWLTRPATRRQGTGLF